MKKLMPLEDYSMALETVNQHNQTGLRMKTIHEHEDEIDQLRRIDKYIERIAISLFLALTIVSISVMVWL